MTAPEDWWRASITGGQALGGSGDAVQFKHWAHAIARHLGCDVAEASSGAVRSFDAVELTCRPGHLWLLRHRGASIVAGAPSLPDFAWSLTGPFADVPADVQPADYGLVALTTVDLAIPMTDEFCEILEASEQRDVRYWKPRTLGQAAFNYWD